MNLVQVSPSQTEKLQPTVEAVSLVEAMPWHVRHAHQLPAVRILSVTYSAEREEVRHDEHVKAGFDTSAFFPKGTQA